jgi:hypothetical protein
MNDALVHSTDSWDTSTGLVGSRAGPDSGGGVQDTGTHVEPAKLTCTAEDCKAGARRGLFCTRRCGGPEAKNLAGPGTEPRWSLAGEDGCDDG